MPDRMPWLADLLPERARRDLFEPSWHDLQFEQFTACRRSRPRLALAELLLFLQCLFVHYTSAAPPSPPKERLSMLVYLIRHALRLLVRPEEGGVGEGGRVW